ncbi:MAG: GNAT family N-acetyltransferase [Clostridia bacterium]|nr:GNAT family N-acetyltransferase [Clostridia bacterium]
MIRLAGAREAAEIIARRDNPALLVRIQALLTAYGTEQRFFEAWVHNGESLIARLGGAFEVFLSPGADFEELAAFLSAQQQLLSVSGESESLNSLLEYVCFSYDSTYSNILALTQPGPYAEPAAEIDRSPLLAEVYDLLRDAGYGSPEIGDFEHWYVDMSHRVRHGCASACLISQQGFPAACCLVYALSGSAGLLGGVAVRPAFRGRGLASALTGFAAHALQADGRLPVLECGDALVGFYERLGFRLLPQRRLSAYMTL